MILGRPWALLLLAVPVLLLWLRLRAQRPREAEASSLLVWKKVSAGEAAPTRPRPPLSAWLEAAGVLLLVVGAADPANPAPAPAAVRVLLDTSPSMNAKRPDGKTRLEYAHSLLGGVDVRESREAERNLPALLAVGVPLVVVTDHRLAEFPDDPPRLRVVGVGAPGFNAGITAASGELVRDGKWSLFLVLEAYGAAGPVEATLSGVGDRRTVTMTPGHPLDLTLDLDEPRFPRPFPASLAASGDVLDADDGLLFFPPGLGGGQVAAEVPERPELDALARALEASGARVGRTSAEAAADARVGRIRLNLPESVGGEEVPGSSVVATDHPLVRGVQVDPAVTLGKRAGTVPVGIPILVDGKGPLATVEPGVPDREEIAPVTVHLAFLPGGSWVDRDPSFVVFVKNLVEHAGFGPPWISTGVRSPVETREAAEGEAFGDLAMALEEARRPDPAGRTSTAAVLLFAAAGLLAAAWWCGR